MMLRLLRVMAIAVALFLIWLFGLIGGTNACKAEPLQLDKFSVTFARLQQRDPMLPEIGMYDFQMQLATEFDLSIFKHVYWKNKIHGETAYSKFMGIGWEYDLGIHAGKYVDIFWQHHSRHSLDVSQPYYYSRETFRLSRIQYPMRDAFGIRFNFIPERR